MKQKYIYMLYPEGKPKALTLSYDDGVRQDERLVDILNRYGIKGTFNLCSGLLKGSGAGKNYVAGGCCSVIQGQWTRSGAPLLNPSVVRQAAISNGLHGDSGGPQKPGNYV